MSYTPSVRAFLFLASMRMMYHVHGFTPRFIHTHLPPILTDSSLASTPIPLLTLVRLYMIIQLDSLYYIHQINKAILLQRCRLAYCCASFRLRLASRILASTVFVDRSRAPGSTMILPPSVTVLPEPTWRLWNCALSTASWSSSLDVASGEEGGDTEG